MIKLISKAILSLAVLGTLVLSGCSKDEEASVPAAAAVEGSELLRYIPADAPYAFASLEPLPDDVLDALEPKLDKVLESYQVVLKEVVAGKLAEDSEDPVSEEDAEGIMGFVNELGSIMSVDGMRSAGIARDSMIAF